MVRGMRERVPQRDFRAISRTTLALLLLFSISNVSILKVQAQVSTSDSITLIEEDYESGRIMFEQALIFKAYAIFDQQMLPFRYQRPELTRKATMAIREIQDNWNYVSAAARSVFEVYGLGPLLPVQQSPSLRRPTGLNLVYDTVHFKLHYTISGTHAVDPTDSAPANGIPDYVESMGAEFQNVESVEVTFMGWVQPPSDGVKGGDNRYDIYIMRINAYGITYRESLVRSPYPNSATSYVAMRNSYTGLSGTPLGLMQVTAAHEYNHAIQFTYDAYEQTWVMEGTATWMEDEVYDDVNDYIGYLPEFFGNPDIALYSTKGYHEYGSCIFFKYMSEHVAAPVVRSVWQYTTTLSTVDSFESALSSYGADPQMVFEGFTTSNYVKTIPPYDYTEASLYPSVRVEGLLKFSAELVSWRSEREGNGRLEPFSCDYIRIQTTKDRIKVFFDGLNTKTAFSVQLALVGSSTVTVMKLTLDVGKDGFITLGDAGTYSDIVLIVMNEGFTPTGNNYIVEVSQP